MGDFDLDALIAALTAKDTERWVSFYADDAEWIEYRHTHPPRAPHRIRGRAEIEPFIRGICASSVEFSSTRRVVGDDGAAFNIDCLLPDGRRIVEHVMIQLADGKIVRQTDVEAGDPRESVGETEGAADAPASAAEQAAEAWLARYGAAWTERDADAAAALFTEDGLYAWGPFDELRGRDAIRERWAAATSDQREVDFSFRGLGATREGVVVRWRSTMAIEGADASEVEIDGILVIRLDSSGRCSEFREWWRERPAP